MKKKLLVPLFLAGMAIPILANGKEIKGVDAAFIGEFGERQAYIEHGTKINTQLAEEGFVLLKNDGTFPMRKGSKITAVGKTSINLIKGGQGCGALGSIGTDIPTYDLQKSLTEAGFVLNEKATSFYNTAPGKRTNGNDGWRGNSEVTIGETPIESLKRDADLMNSFKDYKDLAIQVISREGSEGTDILTIDATDDVKFGQSEKHALELSDNEQALFDELHSYFDKILILINSSNIFECNQFINDPKVAGILWIGNPGVTGLKAVGEILNGEVNPSGRTVDTWTRDFTKDPSFQNFSDNRHNTGVVIPDRKGRQAHQSADTMFNADGTPMRDYGVCKTYMDTSNPNYLEDPQYKVVNGGLNGVKPASFVSYEEGIYNDYRYYETRYADMLKVNKNQADAWYNSQEGVVFPFGYGLSYTTFKQEIVGIKPAANTVLDENSDLVEVSVKVSNLGDVAGKDAVQLYWKAPYTVGGIEKADHVLCAFDKTDLIYPGKSQTIHLTFHLEDVADYDYLDANNNNHVGYELEAGDYAVMCMKNAHESYDEKPLKVKNGGIVYENDRVTGNEVTNRFTDRGFYSSLPGANDIEFTQMSRADFEGTFPVYPSFEDRTVKAGSRYEEYLTTPFDLVAFEEGQNYERIPEAAHRTAADGADWEQTGNHTIMLDEMKGYALSDPKWDEFINEFSWNELMTFVENHKMGSPYLNQIGKKNGRESDGPQKFCIIPWVSSPIVAATFNPRLVHEQGECIGMEGNIEGKCGWWGTAINLHRSPFGGRNFEYYSADPFLTGRIAAELTKAVTDRGVYSYVKHFAVSEQEKNRESVSTFVNEQALRELYLKPFQMVVQEGKTVGIFGSYNRLGMTEVMSNYPLLTEVLRNEWEFEGSILSDMTHCGNSYCNSKCYENVANRVLGGCNCQLDSTGFNGQIASYYATWNSQANNGKGAPVLNETQGIAWSLWNACREAVKGHMYMFVNSLAMNRGLTQVVGQTNEIAITNETIRYSVLDDLTNKNVKPGSYVDVYDDSNKKSTKQIYSIEGYEINNRCELPDGISFDPTTGVISGTFKNAQLARIDVIINVKFVDDTNGKIAYKYVINVMPFYDPNENTPPENPGEPGNTDQPIISPTEKCKLSVGAASAFVSSLTLLGALLIVLNKKRNK